MRTTARLHKFLKGFEGFRATAYIPVKGDKWTIGYGFTEGVEEGDTMTRAEADARFIEELAKYEYAVERATHKRCTQSQFDALVSLAYNIGIGALQKSTVLKAHNREDFAAAARAFALYNKSGGKVYPGLVKRRAAEAAMYLESSGEDLPQDMPQTVDSEPRFTQSSIGKGSIIAGSTATVATVAETLNTVNMVKDTTHSLGDWMVPLLLVVVVIAIGYIAWERIQIRKGGYK